MPGPLSDAHAVTRLPAQDLDRARRFCHDKRFICAGTEFHLFSSAGSASGASVQMGFEVTDLEAVIEDLRRRGVTFEAVEVPGFEMQGEMVVAPNNYLSKGAGELGAFFYDSEGNLLALGQATDGADARGPRLASIRANVASAAVSDMTHVGVDELKAVEGFLEGFRFRRAGAQMGVTPFGMSIIDMPAETTAYPEHDHSSEGPGNPPAHLRKARISDERFRRPGLPGARSRFGDDPITLTAPSGRGAAGLRRRRAASLRRRRLDLPSRTGRWGAPESRGIAPRQGTHWATSGDLLVQGRGPV